METHLKKSLVLVLAFSIVAGLGYAETINQVPTTITKSGYYEFEKDLTYSSTSGFAISVAASNVIIDLKGHTLTSTVAGFTNGIGINVGHNAAEQGDFTNIAVQNGTISAFRIGVIVATDQNTVQNLRLLNNAEGVTSVSTSFNVVQNCLIIGPAGGKGLGVYLLFCSADAVKNNQLGNCLYGVYSFGTGGCACVQNYIAKCTYGLNLGSTDKYQGNVTTGCATPFSGGIAVGDENN